MFYPNTSPCFTLKHPDVLDTQSYGVYSSVPTSFMLSPGISSSGTWYVLFAARQHPLLHSQWPDITLLNHTILQFACLDKVHHRLAGHGLRGTCLTDFLVRGTRCFGYYVLYPCCVFRQRRYHQNEECRDVWADCRFFRHHCSHHHQLLILLLKELA